MSWKEIREGVRRRSVERYDSVESEAYDSYVAFLSTEDEDAYLADINRLVTFEAKMRILDAGAGTGTMCKLLSRVPEVELHALEPSPAMLARLQSKPELQAVRGVLGYCDNISDRLHFAGDYFDAIVSRQLTNGLFDPLTAFANWFHWLKPGGRLLVIDGFYGRDGWRGEWGSEVDMLPLSSNQSMALVPYLLESVGFEVDGVELMHHANTRPVTKTTRYQVAATKPTR